MSPQTTDRVDYVLMAELMVQLLPPHRKWRVTMDRTTWQFGGFTINILLVGLVYQGVAFSLCFGCCWTRRATPIRRAHPLMEQVLPANRIYALIADREFIGQQWFS